MTTTSPRDAWVDTFLRASAETADARLVADQFLAAGWRPPLPADTGGAKTDLVELLNVSHDEAQGWRYWNFGHGADTILAAGWLPPSGPLPEWCCPACGETTRARLADKVPPLPDSETEWGRRWTGTGVVQEFGDRREDAEDACYPNTELVRREVGPWTEVQP